jgi:Uma2 family endonuclease
MNTHFQSLKIERTTQAADGLPRWRWTTAELLQMVELGVLDADEKIELIGGEIVPMSPTGRVHEVLADELAQYWSPRAPTDAKISVERQFNLDAFTYTDPDLIVRPAGIKSYDVRGDTVLLVVEIADTSWEKDIGTKARLYASFGVREYWVINALNRVTRVHRNPLSDTYGDVRELAGDELLTPLLVPQLAVRLASLDLD